MIGGAAPCLQVAPATSVQRDMYGSRYVELAGGWRVVCQHPEKYCSDIYSMYIDYL